MGDGVSGAANASDPPSDSTAATTTTDGSSNLATSSTQIQDDVNANEEAQHGVVLCFACNKPGTQRCSGCHNARYCASECQKKDWTLHKLLCKSFANFGERPSPKHHRAILFPDDETKPKFIWIKKYGPKYWEFDRKAHLGGGDVRLKRLDFDCHRPLRRLLNHTITIWYDEDFIGHGRPVNESLKKSLGPHVAPAWRGRFLAHAYQLDGSMDEDGEEQGRMVDLDTAAIAPVLDYLKWRTESGGLFGYGC
jgi:hypothetical protein